MNTNYDLTDPLGIFSYLAANNDLFKPIKEDYEKTKAENEQLKVEVKKVNEENEQLKADNVSTMVALTDVYEQLLLLQGGSV